MNPSRTADSDARSRRAWRRVGPVEGRCRLEAQCLCVAAWLGPPKNAGGKDGGKEDKDGYG